MYPLTTPEEELKLKVAKDFFAEKIYDTTRILGRIDFCVSLKEKPSGTAIHFIWGEAKKGRADIYASLVQLILTIGKEKTFANELPPVFLCAFDAEKIAFLPYHKIAPFFDKSGFNWSVTPSNHNSPEFKALYDESKALLESEKLLFSFADSATHGENSAKNAAHSANSANLAKNSAPAPNAAAKAATAKNVATAAKAPNSANPKPNPALKAFIKANLTLENEQISKLQITKDNFKHIYYKWLDAVAPSISIDWEAEKPDILSADFFLADLLSDDNITLKKTLRILLQSDFYKVKLEKRANSSSFNFTEFTFKDNAAAHKAFWRLYARPPKEDYWDYILERRDYLVPMDIRERKGAFFTPQIWVAKAQHYLSSALNSAFEDCVIWDCAAGTGNLLRGLPQKPAQIYASTLDKADVEIMRELYAKEGALLENHIFEFDFLNDEFFDICDDKGNVLKKSPLPQTLQNILNDENSRKNLIIFINPPYAEATSATTPAGTGQNKSGVAINNKIYEKYKDILGKASNEIFAQFFIRIQQEIQGCILASFSTLKYLNSQNFAKFRQTFQAEFKKGFMCPANTFDNVKGEFPIGFLIWNLNSQKNLKETQLDIFERDGEFMGKKGFYADLNSQNINQWIKKFTDNDGFKIALLDTRGNDFQNQQYISIKNPEFVITAHSTGIYFTPKNLIPICVYYAVRHTIEHTWINHNDQFLYPNDKWQDDIEFQTDCLAFTLFHNKNRISGKENANHFIPFSLSEVGGTKESFASNFMFEFINGKIKPKTPETPQTLATPSLRGDKVAEAIHSKGDTLPPQKTLFPEIQAKAQNFIPTKPLKFSIEAKKVFEAGRELYKYYHAQDFKDPAKPYNANASLYDIKEHFQGRDEKGKMNPPQKAPDPHYKELLSNLNTALKTLAEQKIKQKIYDYGFLRE